MTWTRCKREWIKNRNKLDQNGLGERIAQKQKHKE